MKKLTKGILTVVIAGAVIGACTNGENKSTSSTAKVGESKQAEVKQPQFYKEGDIVKIGKFEITLKNAKFTTPAEYSEAKNGKVITVELHAKNASDQEAYLSSIDVTVNDAAGNMAESYYGYNDYQFDSQMRAGTQYSGKLAFDVKEAEAYEIVFEPTFSWSDEEVVWKVSKAELAN